MKIYDSFTTVIYTFKVSKRIIIGQSTNINVLSWLLFFFKLKERESGIQNLDIKEKWPQSYLSYFSTGFHWRLFLLSRANRLYSIFLHWLEEPGVPRVSGILLSSTRNTGYGSVCHEPCSKTNFLTIYFRWRRGEAPLPFWGPSQSFGFSLLPLGVRRPEVTKYQHLLISPLWPTFFLNGHSLTARYCQFKHEE